MTQTDANKHNILVVDDELENLDFLTQILTLHGYQVRPAINGQIALEAVRNLRPILFCSIS